MLRESQVGLAVALAAFAWSGPSAPGALVVTLFAGLVAFAAWLDRDDRRATLVDAEAKALIEELAEKHNALTQRVAGGEIAKVTRVRR